MSTITVTNIFTHWAIISYKMLKKSPTKDLSWSTHIGNICGKANSALGLMRRNLSQCTPQCHRTAYLALIRSNFDYASTVWDPYLVKDIKTLEKIQKKAARFIKGDYHSREPGCVTKVLADLDLPTLQDRRRENRLCFLLYKIDRGLVPAIDKNTYLKPIREKRKVKAKT